MEIQKRHYHPRYKAQARDDRNWRPDNFRDENRFHQQHGSGHGINRYQESEPFQCDIEIHLIGRKIKDPVIHVCEICSLPIRSYGRMIPCKHVFCFSCAKKTDHNCPRCNESVQRIEQCPLGSVWLCSVAENCKRTYLSHRDLQAHINHRHKPAPPPNVPPILPHPLVLPPVSVVGTHPPITVPPPPLLPPRPEQYLMVSAPHSVAPPTSAPMPNIRIPQTTLVNSTVSARPSNLITIQIQDDQSNIASPNAYPPPPPPPPRRPLNQPQLLPQSRDPHHPPPQQPPRRF